MKTLSLLLLTILLPALAEANAPVGTWSNGTTALSVAADGHYDWTTSVRAAEGTWSTAGPLMSLESDAGLLTYAYEVAEGRLTLTDTSGAQLVFEDTGATAER
jgi:hypothetical protein